MNEMKLTTEYDYYQLLNTCWLTQ